MNHFGGLYPFFGVLVGVLGLERLELIFERLRVVLETNGVLRFSSVLFTL